MFQQTTGLKASLTLAGFGIVLAATLCQSAEAATLCVNPKIASCFSTIGAAVTAASAGDTIKVAVNTYKEDVVINKSLSLIGADEGTTIIDATGKSNGIFVNGRVLPPAGIANGDVILPGVSDVVISGFTVKNANFEGILVVNASDVTISGNHVTGNNKSLITGPLSCPGLPSFETNEGDDCGEGIHLMGVDHSTVASNEVDQNAGGILISDETAPNHDNLITGNSVHNNNYDCGITLASHAPAPLLPGAGPTGQAPALPFGIYHNTISGNNSSYNGLFNPGAGAGVGIFAPFPGTKNWGNVVVGNTMSFNGLPGFTMHNHAWSALAPAVNMNDNVIVGNTITRNAADTDDAATPGTTGINIFSVAPVTGTIISQNHIEQEAVNVAIHGPITVEVHLNDFDSATIGVDNIGGATINATQNWWNCTAGPNATGCATTVGAMVSTPWLTSPF